MAWCSGSMGLCVGGRVRAQGAAAASEPGGVAGREYREGLSVLPGRSQVCANDAGAQWSPVSRWGVVIDDGRALRRPSVPYAAAGGWRAAGGCARDGSFAPAGRWICRWRRRAGGGGGCLAGRGGRSAWTRTPGAPSGGGARPRGVSACERSVAGFWPALFASAGACCPAVCGAGAGSA